MREFLELLMLVYGVDWIAACFFMGVLAEVGPRVVPIFRCGGN